MQARFSHKVQQATTKDQLEVAIVNLSVLSAISTIYDNVLEEERFAFDVRSQDTLQEEKKQGNG